MSKTSKVEPEVETDGAYCYCPQCGFYRLLPVRHTHCPKCSVELDWDWLEKYKIKRK